MTALSANAIRKFRNVNGMKTASVQTGTAAVIYAGALVSINTTTGRAVAATAATGRKILGVAMEDGSSGDYVKVAYHTEFLFATPTKAYVGCNVAVSDDNTCVSMSAAGTTAVRVRVGELMQMETASTGWVAIRHFSESDV